MAPESRPEVVGFLLKTVFSRGKFRKMWMIRKLESWCNGKSERKPGLLPAVVGKMCTLSSELIVFQLWGAKANFAIYSTLDCVIKPHSYVRRFRSEGEGLTIVGGVLCDRTIAAGLRLCYTKIRSVRARTHRSDNKHIHACLFCMLDNNRIQVAF